MVGNRLDDWTELIGKLDSLKVTDSSVSVRFQSGDSLEYPVHSNEGQILKDRLETIPTGTKIGILQTDLKEKQIRVRVVEEGVMIV